MNNADRVKHFTAITKEMADIFARKNRDYGNSFEVSLDEDGLLVTKIRLGDKYKRFAQLIKKDYDAQVRDESLRDTLVDMANYAIMTVMWMDNNAGELAVRDMERAADDKLDALQYGMTTDYVNPLVFVDKHGNKLADYTPVNVLRRKIESGEIQITPFKLEELS